MSVIEARKEGRKVGKELARLEKKLNITGVYSLIARHYYDKYLRFRKPKERQAFLESAGKSFKRVKEVL